MKVHVKEIDESPYFYTSRSLDIQLRCKTISTPTRALTNGELNAKARVPSDLSLPADVSCFSTELTSEDVNSLMTRNATSESKIRSLENNAQRMQHSEMILQSMQPSRTAVQEILTTDDLREKFLRMIFQIQKEAGLAYLSVPWVGYTPDKAADEIRKLARDSDQEPIFFLDLAMEASFIKELMAPIMELVETQTIHILGLLYRPVRTALATYDTLWNSLKGTDVVTMLVNVPRYNPEMEDLSSAHFNEFILGDILVPKPPRRFFKPEKDTQEEKGIERSLRVFYGNELTVTPVGKMRHEDWIGEMASELPDGAVRLALENYREAERDKDKKLVLTSISKVHEFIVSGREFESSKRFIVKNETEDYVKSKTVLSRSLKKARSQCRLGP